MIPILTRTEMANIDKAAANSSPEAGFHYMQKAARGLFDFVINRYLELQKKGHKPFVTVFAGKGNNAGDGILLAALLAEEGYPVKCFITGSLVSLTKESQLAYKELDRNNKKNQYISLINDIADIELVQYHFKQIVGHYDKHFFVDALLGIGASGETREPVATLIRFMNEYRNQAHIIAVDLPSGTDPDTGALNGTCVKAHTTISMGYPKFGSLFFPGRANYGLTIVQDLGYDPALIEQEFKSQIYFANSVKQLLPPRMLTGSKYDHGFATLVAGSPGMEGAASLAARAAYKSGLGLLKLITDGQTRQIVATQVIEMISEDIAEQFLTQVQIKNPACLGLGPGLSLAYKDRLATLMTNYTKPMILDADAINSIDLELLSQHKGDLLLTPHAGEYQRLFGSLDTKTKPIELIQQLQMKAREYKINILYKGTPTIIIDQSGKAFVLPYGNSALAKAGSGDVLTGLILGFAAQIYTMQSRYADLRFFHTSFEISPLTQAAIIAAYTHGKAAEKSSRVLTEHCVIASDLLDYIPKVLLEL